MSRLKDHIVEIASITIEAESPIALSSGRSTDTFDTITVKDANGLPALPGSSIAGVLRHAIASKNPDLENELFGTIDSNSSRMSSRVEVYWGYVHNSKNQHKNGWIPQADVGSDPIWNAFTVKDNADFFRHHVSLNAKGTVSEHGKFDRTFVPKGTRFTFEIRYWHNGSGQENWSKLLDIVQSPIFRLGSATRSGYGSFKVVELKKGSFDIKLKEDLVKLAEPLIHLKKSEIAKTSLENKITLNLEFPLGVRISGGSQSLTVIEKKPDALMWSEKVIIWDNAVGTLSNDKKVVIPGTSLKGSLRHRTAFHYARLCGQWAEESDLTQWEDGLDYLFGNAKNDDSGMAGKLYFKDLYLDDFKASSQMRNSIDRFTGGVLNHVLFGEEKIATTNGKFWTTEIMIQDINGIDSNLKKAFEFSLLDLKNGLLSVGAGASHGLGFAHANIQGIEVLR